MNKEIAELYKRYNGKCPWGEDAESRLIGAILDQTLSDWDKYAKCLWSKPMRVIAMYELKQIINFIMSDWYVYLTNGNSSQETIVKGLINRVTFEECKKELLEYAKSKSQKPYLIKDNESIKSGVVRYYGKH